MTPDFEKIQTGMVNGLNQTTRVNEEVKVKNEEAKPSFKSIEREDMETGVAGRSSVKMDNFETDMRRFNENPALCGVAMETVDQLCKKGYSYEEAIDVAFKELGLAK